MFVLAKALGVVKLTAITAILTTAVATGAVQASLPSQATNGQDRATAGAANRHAGDQPATNEHAQGPNKEAVVARLGQNRDRVIANLTDVLSRLQDSNANQHAMDALQKVVDLMTSGDVGLNRASEVVADHGGGNAGLPGPAVEHPTPDNHPGRP